MEKDALYTVLLFINIFLLYHKKVFAETVDPKIKIAANKNNEKEVLLLGDKRISKNEYCYKNYPNVQVNQILPGHMHQWEISHQT